MISSESSNSSLKEFLRRMIDMDGGHAWKRPRPTVAEDKVGIIYEGLFVNYEVFCTKPHENLSDK
jgi:hypothetical protein